MENVIESEIYHEVDRYDFFLDPNSKLTEMLGQEVDVFDKEQKAHLFSFTRPISWRKVDRIKAILKHGTPRYVNDVYPKDRFSKEYPAGDFFAFPYFRDKAHMYDRSDQYGRILLVYNQRMFREINSNWQFRIKRRYQLLHLIGRNPCAEGLETIVDLTVLRRRSVEEMDEFYDQLHDRNRRNI